MVRRRASRAPRAIAPKIERRGRRRLRAAVNVEHERIRFAWCVVGRIDEHAGFTHPVVLPSHRFDVTEIARCERSVEIGEPDRIAAARRNRIEFDRSFRVRAGKCDLARFGERGGKPERPRGIHVARRNALEAAVELLERVG